MIVVNVVCGETGEVFCIHRPSCLNGFALGWLLTLILFSGKLTFQSMCPMFVT